MLCSGSAALCARGLADKVLGYVREIEGFVAFVESIRAVFVPGAVVALEWAAIVLARLDRPHRWVLLAEITAFAALATLFTSGMRHEAARTDWAAPAVILYVLAMPTFLRMCERRRSHVAPFAVHGSSALQRVSYYGDRLLGWAAATGLLLVAGFALLVAVYLAQ